MFQPDGAIITKDQLEPVIVLGLSVEVWDVDMNTIRTRHPTGYQPGMRGAIIHFKDGMGQYAKWFGFDDPTYNATEVLWSLPDDQIEKAEAHTASMYMFNTREEAVVAQKAYNRAQALKRKLQS